MRNRNIWRFWHFAVVLVVVFWGAVAYGVGFILWMLYNVLLKQGLL